jgi:hypothetical protein
MRERPHAENGFQTVTQHSKACADAQCFIAMLDRALTDDEAARVYAGVLDAYRWQYIVSGLDELRFADLLAGVLNEAHVQRLVAAALNELGEPLKDGGDLVLHGPFPAYVGNAVCFSRGHTRKGVTMTGWRALATLNGEPVASVNIAERTNQAGDPIFDVRGAQAAIALSNALKTAQAWLDETGAKVEARFLAFPSLFITAVWLHGNRTCFVPTRLNERGRPKARVMTRVDLMRIVAQERRRHAITGPGKPSVSRR